MALVQNLGEGGDELSHFGDLLWARKFSSSIKTINSVAVCAANFSSTQRLASYSSHRYSLIFGAPILYSTNSQLGLAEVELDRDLSGAANTLSCPFGKCLVVGLV